jgi:hypothetical protein
MVQSQPRQKFTSPYLEQALHKKRVGGAAQGVGLEFKSQYRKKKKNLHSVSGAQSTDFWRPCYLYL